MRDRRNSRSYHWANMHVANACRGHSHTFLSYTGGIEGRLEIQWKIVELTDDQKIQIYCSALQGILTVASTNTVLTGDPSAHAFRIANRAILLIEERGLAKSDSSAKRPAT